MKVLKFVLTLECYLCFFWIKRNNRSRALLQYSCHFLQCKDRVNVIQLVNSSFLKQPFQM